MPKTRKKTQKEITDENKTKAEEIWDDNPFDDGNDDNFDERG